MPSSYRLVLTVVAAVALGAPGSALASITAGGRLSAATQGAPCTPAKAGTSGCAEVQITMNGAPRAVRSRGVITKWAAAGVGVGGVFVADVASTGGITRGATSSLRPMNDTTPLSYATRLTIAPGQYVALIVTAGSSMPLAPAAGSAAFGYSPAPEPGAYGAPAVANAAPYDLGYEATVEPDVDDNGYGDETPLFLGLPAIAAARQDRAPKVRFRLSASARVKATVQLNTRGRKRKRTRTFHARTGRNVASLGKLKAGRFRLTLVATGPTGVRSKPATANFTVKPK